MRGRYRDQCHPEDVNLGHCAGAVGGSGFPCEEKAACSSMSTSDLAPCVVFVTQVNKLKREMVHLQQELQFKEHGFQTLKK